MITKAIFDLILSIVSIPFGIFPQVSSLPLGIDAIFVTAMGWWHTFSIDVPSMAFMFTYMLWYMSLEVGLFVMRLLLGAHVPDPKE